MNTDFIKISGTNTLSVRLAHARAISMQLRNISTIDGNALYFTVSKNQSQPSEESERTFIKWCEALTAIKYNRIDLQVTKV